MLKSLHLKSSLTTTLCMLSAAAVAQQAPTAQWGNLFGGAMTSGDQSIAIATSADGNIFWLNTANTDESTPIVYYADQEIYNNPTKTNNLMLLCTDADGALKWQVSTTTADAVSGQGGVAVDNDGNVIIAAKVRQLDGKDMNIVSADGSVSKLGDAVEKRFYQIMVAKISASGEILWTKLFEQSTAPASMATGSNADFTSDGVSVSALTVDDQGNIYVGGSYRTDMTIDGVTLAPQNVATWTGDSQSTCGNMFIVKLSADGHYTASAIGQGEINGASAVNAMTWNDGKLYVYGYAKGDAPFTFAGESLAPTSVNSPIIASLTPALTANWVKCCPGETVDGKSALQNVGISVFGNNLWLAGQFNQKILDTAGSDKFVAATQGSTREGFVIKIDKNSGEWLASADSRVDFPEITKLCGYFKVIQNPSALDVAYVYGYTMDATQGIFLRKYSAQTLQPVTADAWNIVIGGGVPSAVASAFDESTASLYITGRGNKAFTLTGTPEITTDATKSWDVLMAKFKLPLSSNSIIDSFVNNEDDAEIYDISGRNVGRDKNGLAPGIYISNNKKFIVR